MTRTCHFATLLRMEKPSFSIRSCRLATNWTELRVRRTLGFYANMFVVSKQTRFVACHRVAKCLNGPIWSVLVCASVFRKRTPLPTALLLFPTPLGVVVWNWFPNVPVQFDKCNMIISVVVVRWIDRKFGVLIDNVELSKSMYFSSYYYWGPVRGRKPWYR